METENINMNSGRKSLFIILIIFCLFVVYYCVMSMMGPARKMAEIKKEFTPRQDEKKEADDRMLSDSACLRLLKERAFLQARIVMAETDSIYLTINMQDSSMNLEICGVVVHKAKMSHFRVSKILTNGDENVISAMLAVPFTISSDFATIKKEPVMIKNAPKDTSEYKPDIMPDTSITEPVNYILEMTDGTRIFVYQEENEKRADRMTQLKFDLTDRLHQSWVALKNVAVLKVPEYHPFIKIRLPRSDAKIIYRAIPKNGQISVFL
jgi:hypothetical protein